MSQIAFRKRLRENKTAGFKGAFIGHTPFTPRDDTSQLLMLAEP